MLKIQSLDWKRQFMKVSIFHLYVDWQIDIEGEEERPLEEDVGAWEIEYLDLNRLVAYNFDVEQG